MPTLTLTFAYDGSDPEIMQALSRMVAAFGSPTGTISLPTLGSQVSSSVERIATKFAGLVYRTPRLRAVMEEWLRRGGKIPLSELVRISGVKKQHDYAGIGSALTRNMKAAGGPKDWYDGHQDVAGAWIYEIADELVAPLRKAFKIT
ncbi:MAG TPA: hypothetical protein VNK82_13690 [Terriglobales bacterium]|nr:hypothetical protein [Terriglobales bacterium]